MPEKSFCIPYEARMFASDFDGTQFLTSERAQDISTVSDAYAIALDSMFGPEASDSFLNEGGHNHRTPSEIIRSLLTDETHDKTEKLAQDLTERKLEVLLDQIGKKLSDGALWPRPTDGFAKLWDFVNDSDAADKPRIFTTVLSAGHAVFIERVFETHGLCLPDAIVTDELLISDYGMAEMPLEARAKPATPLLEVATALWLDDIEARQKLADEPELKSRVVYAGDSPEKDGGMAQNFGVDFVLIDETSAEQGWSNVGIKLGLGVGFTAISGVDK